MKQFRNRILISLIPCLIAAYFVGVAWYRYQTYGGGFKFGVDLVGGTILVYEIDVDKFTEEQLKDFKSEDLAASLKRRIDPTDLYNVIIRPVSQTRVEIILPTGGAHQQQTDQKNWAALLKDVRDKWPKLASDEELDRVGRGDTRRLAAEIETRLKAEKVDIQEIDAFINEKYAAADKQRTLGAEEINRIKELIGNVGNLEFRILANEQDDRDATEAAAKYFADLSGASLSQEEKDKRLKELESRALRGLPPPSPVAADGSSTFPWRTPFGNGQTRYSWVEVGKQERASLGLSNANETAAGNQRWKQAEEARNRNVVHPMVQLGQTLLYSRKCSDRGLSPEEREVKKYEYFLLTRDPAPGEEVTGQYLVGARPGSDQNMRPAVNFTFNNTGANLFYAVTNANRPHGPQGSEFRRYLAILLDNQIVNAPTLNEPIRNNGQISGPSFRQDDVDSLVRILNAGRLPATLKRTPVSETTIGPTLGADTIEAGSRSVVLAFLAVLAFMVFYYRFAGLVASVALLANLLLTVGFMIAVQATFTLPGLAGMVLMLALAVDANVLIYERLREERDRGASLSLAIRNGYDRAFPTIIDTHLTSILTAIILYIVGNDQLKGFGVSLTAGLIISLFTSLYMTRLMFDLWNHMGWLRKLSMLRLVPHTQIDFMAMRNYFFAGTAILSVLGVGLFLYRAETGLNIDFIGGTAYSGELVQPIDALSLRKNLADQSVLAVADVQPLGSDGTRFEITYDDGGGKRSKQTVRFAERTAIQDVRTRASHLPDWSVEQIFLSDPDAEPGKSRYFTVRTSERAPDLVLITVNRLLQAHGSPLKRTMIGDIQVDGRAAYLQFVDENGKPTLASPGHLKIVLEGLFQDELHKHLGQESTVLRAVDVIGGQRDAKGVFQAGSEGEDGRFKQMRIELSDVAAPHIPTADFQRILQQAAKDFETRPQPMRLENFDKALAADSQSRALYAIVLSWLIILVYLWFRFGSWAFGTAAVLCLVHDLTFTLGIIAACHYIHEAAPALAQALLIQDFKIDLPAVAALLTLIGYSVNDTIVVFDRIREVRGKNPELTPQTINDSVNQTLSRTLLTSLITFITVLVLYIFGGDGIHLFAFVMVVGVIVGTYSSIYVASPLLLIFGEGKAGVERAKQPEPEPAETEPAEAEA